MLRIIFFGTPHFTVPFLDALKKDVRFEIAGIVSQPDAIIGRKKVLTAPPAAVFAKENAIPLFQPKRIKKNHDFIQELGALKADVFVVYAYGKILPDELLSMPRLGTVNVHPSKLPLYRGPTPLQTAIRNGDSQTAISIMKIDAEMDHGPILAAIDVDIAPNETYPDMEAKVSKIGPPLLLETLAAYAAGNLEPIEQDHATATYCSLLSRQDGYIATSDSVQDIWNKWRAFYPWPGVTFKLTNEKVYKLHALSGEMLPGNGGDLTLISEGDQLFAEGGGQKMKILTIQEEGRAAISAADFIRGLPSQQIQEKLKEMS